MTVAGIARADEAATKRAHEAYQQGVKLHGRGDYLGATQAFARADEASPSPVALRAALDESLFADDPVLALSLVDRAAREPSLAERAKAVRARFVAQVGRVVVHCPSDVGCMVTRDGAAASAERAEWVRAGRHTLVAQLGDQAETRVVDVPAGETIEVTFKSKPPAAVPIVSAPAPASAPSSAAPPKAETRPPTTDEPRPHERARGLSPVFFYVGAGLTAVLGGVTVLSGLDTQSVRKDFEAAGCPSAPGPSCGDLATQGKNARTRTNVLAIGTGLVGGATAVLGLFFVRWDNGGATVNVAGNL